MTSKQRGRFERFLFSFMGPPQLGDPAEPVTPAPGQAGRCPTCQRPYDMHEIVRSPRLTYTRCPQHVPEA